MTVTNEDILGKESRWLNPWSIQTTINQKPLSINAAHYRNKKMTVSYKNYRTAWEIHFNNNNIKAHPEIKDMKLYIGFMFGFSNRASDVDNPLKPAIDTLQNLLDFNDKQVYKVKASKSIVTKGNEFVSVYLTETFDEALTQEKLNDWMMEVQR